MKRIEIDEKKKKELKCILNKYTSYKTFSRNKRSAYAYTKEIGIRVCPYCNINYVYTVFLSEGRKREPILRPSLDHFEGKARNKKLELQWDNLIPSCDSCNSRLKHQKQFKRETHLHPYFDDFDSLINIVISLKASNYLDKDNFDLIFTRTTSCDDNNYEKAEKNIKDFKLTERYQHHKDEAIPIFKKIKYYHKSKVGELCKLLNGDNSIICDLFSEEDCDINQTSLGKLKRDIIKAYK